MRKVNCETNRVSADIFDAIFNRKTTAKCVQATVQQTMMMNLVLIVLIFFFKFKKILIFFKGLGSVDC
jgi:hypothetical protein